ncbi:ABC transporter I family member 20 (ABC transporter ABCI.20) (AtABCI20) (GCN-related protein 3) (Non-intrinsic ABC protein 9), partial [Durusdinium trenchii]
RPRQILELRPLWEVPLGALSDGQRQRVELQRRLGAVETETVVLLDEITAELDMLVRQDLLDWLVEANCTVLNVTHVFEACEGWATHLLYLQGAASHLEPLEPAATAGPWPSLFARAVERLGQARKGGDGWDAPTPMARAALPRAVGTTAGVDIEDLRFDYGRGTVLSVEKLSLPVGCRCLLVGLNGGGKSTLLNVMAGRRMAKAQKLQVLGGHPFEERWLDREISILSSEWKRQVGQMRGQLTFKELADATLQDLQSQGFEPTSLAQRMLRLVQIFSVEPTKPLGLLSDGQLRRCDRFLSGLADVLRGTVGRVQLAVKLVKPARLLLMDEVTADLDVLAREALLRFLREESEDGCSVVYCTHIMDGWATHFLHLGGASGASVEPAAEVEASGASLSGAVLARLRAERERRRAEPPERAAGRPERVAHAADFGDALPLGWHRRHAEAEEAEVGEGEAVIYGVEGAYGNYAWNVEAKPQAGLVRSASVRWSAARARGGDRMSAEELVRLGIIPPEK